MLKKTKNFIKFLPLLVKCFFTTKNRKIRFLYRKILNYFYTIFLIQNTSSFDNQGTNIPAFLIEKKTMTQAKYAAKKELKRVKNQNLIDEYFKKAILSYR